MKRFLLCILALCLGAAAGAEPAALLFKKTSSSKLDAVSGYLFNMHLVYRDADPQSITGSALPLAAAGAADILYRYKPSANFAAIYAARQNEIQKNLEKDLSNAGAFYAADERNAAKERAFLRMLEGSIQSGYYFYSGGPGPQTLAAAGAERLIKNAISSAMKELKNKVAVNPAQDNAFNTNFYINAADDCGTCSHYVCRAFRAADITADGWNILSVYRVTILPPAGERNLRRANGERNFISPDGKKYVSWEYHSAALAVLEKNGEVVYMAADPLLLKKPTDFAYWTGLFDKNAKFILRPFDGTVKLESGKNIISKRDLPKGSVHSNPYLD